MKKPEIRYVPPRSAEVGDDDLVAANRAAEIAGVSRQAIHQWQQAGDLIAVEDRGPRDGYLYRAGDVRDVARRKGRLQ